MPIHSLRSVWAALRITSPAFLIATLLSSAHGATPVDAAEFTHVRAADWINSKPLTLAQLRGKVVLIEF